MYLLQSWKKSLLILKPANFKLFFLVTLKSIWETYKILFRYFWWLITLLCLSSSYLLFRLFCTMFAFSHGIPSKEKIFLYLLWALFFVFLIMYFYNIILITRSSVKRKRWDYFSKYWYSLYSLPFLLLYIFMMLGIIAIEFVGEHFFVHLFLIGGQINLLLILRLIFLLFLMPFRVDIMWPIALIYSPLTIFFVLFVLDSAPLTLYVISKSFTRAIKMIIYNYPLCFIMHIFFSFFVTDFFVVPGPINYFIFLSPIFFMVIPICIFTNLYIKQVHEQFSLYFGSKPAEK